jgi:hypothetical protein
VLLRYGSEFLSYRKNGCPVAEGRAAVIFALKSRKGVRNGNHQSRTGENRGQFAVPCMNVTVCVGSSCHLKGSRQIVEQLQSLIATSDYKDQIELKGAFCMGRCVSGVSVLVDGAYHSLKPEEANAFFTEKILRKMGRR